MAEPLCDDTRRGISRRAVGALREERVVLAFSLPGPLPGWFQSVRPGTPEEDRQGVDVVVTTRDLGPIGVQVKGCKVGVERFRRMHPGEAIAVVIVRETDSDRDVRWKTIQAIATVRAALTAGQGGNSACSF